MSNIADEIEIYQDFKTGESLTEAEKVAEKLSNDELVRQIIALDRVNRFKAIHKLLHNSFTWSNTKQGHDYWSDVVCNIQQIIDAAEKKK